MTLPPVITLDGPSGSGKSTLCRALAKHLGWHYLDSGAMFRALAYVALQQQIDITQIAAVEAAAHQLAVRFVVNPHNTEAWLADTNITQAIREEHCGNLASKLAVLPTVRQILLEKQRAFRQWPGLVTDGRDMGTVVFPDATCKFFISANPEERVRRRLEQLKKQHLHATVAAISQDLQQRDARDEQRVTAPLKPAADAILIDNSTQGAEQTFTQLMQCIVARLPSES